MFGLAAKPRFYVLAGRPIRGQPNDRILEIAGMVHLEQEEDPPVKLLQGPAAAKHDVGMGASRIYPGLGDGPEGACVVGKDHAAMFGRVFELLLVGYPYRREPSLSCRHNVIAGPPK